MPKFTVESTLPIKANELSHAVFTIDALNKELSPYIKMSAPTRWRTQPITQWPINERIFNSQVMLFGLLPIDYHQFRFTHINNNGFTENSTSYLNTAWCHQRTVTQDPLGSKIIDTVEYKSRLGIIGYLFLPVYKAIFQHRHHNLKRHYRG